MPQTITDDSITFTITDNGGTDGECDVGDKNGNEINTSKTYQIRSVTGYFENATFAGRTNEVEEVSPGVFLESAQVLFLDNDGDGNDDSIVNSAIVFNVTSTILWETLSECDEETCVDADEDGQIDYVDFNGDGIADDIMDNDGVAGPDGKYGDHTYANASGRIDATASKIQNEGSETVESCGGEPYNCLMGSNKLMDDWDGERPTTAYPTVYGTGEPEVISFDAQITTDFGGNYFLSNYSKSNSCGVSPLVIHQNSVFHDPDGNNTFDPATEALDSTNISGTAGKALYLNGTVDDMTDNSLFWEFRTSYSNEDFYKGLGDLLYDDLKSVCDEENDNDNDCENDDDSQPDESDFAASVTLPYAYMTSFNDSTNADAKLDLNPQLGISNESGSNNILAI